MNLFLVLLGVLFILFLVALVYIASRDISKGEIVRLFRVDNKTLQKWFDIRMPDFAVEWKKRRKFSRHELNLIIHKLGNPSKFPATNMEGILFKLEAEEKEELPAAKYRLLHKLIPDLKIRFAGMSIFPPMIADHVYRIAKGELDSRELYAI